ncbi:MAG: hypothetical protein ACQEXI_06145 [Pseudomonadota bacterium]
MSCYSLNIARIGRGSGTTEGEHDLVNVLVDGHYQRGLASASLTLEGHDGRPGCCTVFVPLDVMIDGLLTLEYAVEYADHLFGTSDTGTRHYTFSTREAALAFLCRLYGIDAPQPQPEIVDAIAAADTTAPVQQPTASPHRVPAPSPRNVVPAPVPAPTGTAYLAAFYGTAVTPHLFKRNTQ